MGILKFASEETVRLDLGDGDYIEVVKDISKRTFNQIMKAMPNREIRQGDRLTADEGLSFQTALFEAFVKGWSVPEPVTLDNYLALDSDAGNKIDNLLAEHFANLTPSEQEQLKAENSPDTMRKPRARK